MQRSEHGGVIPGRLRWLIVGLIALSTVLFLTGVAIEKSGGGSAAAASSQQTSQTPTDSGDPDGGHEGSSPSQTASSGTAQATTPAETILGLDIEAPWFLAAFLLGWLLLGAALFRFIRPALIALLLVAVATVILDGAEVVHQIQEANPTLVTLAVLVALTHLVIAALSGLALIPNRRQIEAAVR